MKNLNNFSKISFLLLLSTFFFPNLSKAQIPTVQDCLGAIPICGADYNEVNAYQGTGNYPVEINNGPSCLGSGEKNCVWYVFTVAQTGDLEFNLTPNDLSDDYDWAIYNMTTAECGDIFDNPALEVSCNYSGAPGITGANDAAGTQNEAVFEVFAGETYVLNVSQFSNSLNGYNLNLGNSTAIFFDDTNPEPTAVNPQEYCDSTIISCHFSEGITCASIATSNFDVVSLDGAGPYTVTSVNSPTCDVGGAYDNKFQVTFSPALEMGDYELHVTPQAGSQAEDNCGNANLGGIINFTTTNEFTMNIDSNTPTCDGFSDGAIQAEVVGGTGVTYSIDGGPFLDNGGLFTGLETGTYVIKGLTSANCPSTETVVLNPPIGTFSEAGDNADLCNTSDYQLDGNYPDNGNNPLWTTSSSEPIIFIPQLFNTAVSNIPVGITTFTWIMNHSVCGNYVDDMQVTAYDTNTTASPDKTICGTETSFESNNPYPGTGVWTCSDPSVVIDNPSASNIIASNIPVGVHTFTWTATYGSCGSFSAQSVLTAVAETTTADAGTDMIICNQTEVDITAVDEGALGTGVWTCADPSVTFSNISNFSATASNVPDGYVTFIWTMTSGGCSSSSEMIVTNGTEIIANAGDDITVCDSTEFHLSGSVPSTETGFWTSSDPLVTFDNSLSPTAVASNLQVGTNTLTWTLTKGACNTTDEIIITRDEFIIAQANAQDDVFMCETDFIFMSANNPAPLIGTWTSLSPFVNLIQPNGPTTPILNLSYGDNEFIWEITNGVCVSKDTVNIQRLHKPIAVAGKDTSICGGLGFEMDASLPYPAVGNWTTTDAGVSFENASIYNTSVFGLPQGNSTLTWTVTLAENCSHTDEVIVTNDLLIVADANVDEHFCDDTFQLNANIPTAGVGTWTASNANVVFDNSLSETAIISGFDAGAVIFTWTIENGICSSSDQMTLYRDELLDADAGIDSLFCGTTLELYGNSPFPGNGVWNAMTPGAIFVANSLNTTVASSFANGENLLSWTLINGTCSDTDVIKVTSFLPVTATAGSDTSICEPTHEMIGNNPTNGIGTWTASEPGVTFDDETLFNAVASNYPNGSITFTWTVVNGACNATDDMVVTKDVLTLAEANSNAELCNLDYQFAGNQPPDGIGTWTANSGAVTFDNATLFDATATNIPFGETVFTWTITNGTCSTNDDMTIINNELIVADASTDFHICETTSSLSGNNPTSGSGVWTTTNGFGVAAVTSAFNSTVSGLSDGQNTFMWTITNGTCVSSDEVIITKDVLIQAEANDNMELCENTSVQLAADNPTLGYGVWSSSDAGITYDDQSIFNATISNLQIGSTTFTWTVQNGTCFTSDQMTIANGALIAADASTDVHICETDFTLAGNVPAFGTGEWTATSSGTFSNSSVANSSVSGLTDGANTFTWTITSGTCVDSDDVIITKDVEIQAEANTFSDVCENTSIQLGADSPTSGYGVWTSSDGAVTYDDQSVFNATVSNLQTGLTTFTWSVQNGTCLTSDQVTVQNDALIAASADNDVNICQSTYNLLGNVPAPGNGVWSASSILATIADNTLATTSVSSIPVGATTFTWTITNGVCTDSDDIIITKDLEVQAEANTFSPVCENSSIQLGADNPVAGYGVWTSSDGSVTYDDASIFNSTVSNLQSGATTFTWSVQNGTCFTSDQVTVQNDVLITATADTDEHICETNYTLAGNTPTSGSGLWTASPTNANFVNDALPTSGVSNLPDGATTFTWTITNGACTHSDAVIITKDVEIQAEANTFSAVCENTSIQLGADDPTAGYGVWTSSDGSVTYDDESIFNATVSNLQTGSTTFTWSVQNGTCLTSDQVTVQNDILITATADTDEHICETSYTLAGNTPTSGSGLWTASPTNANFVNDALPTSGVTNLPDGATTFTWTITNGACTHSDAVIITKDVEIQAEANTFSAVCENTSIQLSADDPVSGYGVWTSSDGSVTYDDESIFNATISNLQTGSTTFTWSVQNGTCLTSDQVTVQNDVLIAASVGADEHICEGIYTLTGNVPTSGNGAWTANPSGPVFTNDALANSDVSNISEGVATTFTWTITNGACVDDEDLLITRDDEIIANAKEDVDLCETSVYQLDAEEPSLGVGVWSSDNDATIVYDNKSTYNAQISNIPIGVTNFTWTVKNETCSTSDEMVLTNDKLILADASTDEHICETLYVLAGNVPTQGNGVWTSNLVGPEFTNDALAGTQVSNLADGPTTFTWTITNGECVDADEVIIIKDELIVADANEDILLCETSTQVMAATSPTLGYGVWTSSEGSITYDQQSSFSAEVSNLPTGTTTFTWTVQNGKCFSSDEMTITNDILELATVTEDINICETDYTLAANSPVLGNGAWSSSTSAVLFDNSFFNATSISNIPDGVNTLTWTITNGACVSSDDINITKDVLIISDANQDERLCNIVNYDLAGNSPSLGTGVWTSSQPEVIFDNTAANDASVNNLPIGATIFTWTITNGTCVNSDQVVISNDNPITAMAGVDESDCNISSYQLAGSDAQTGIGTWTSSATDVTFDTNSLLSATASSLPFGTTTFTWTVVNGACETEDFVEITNDIFVPAQAGADTVLCDVTSLNLYGEMATPGTGLWTSSDLNVSFDNNASQTSTVNNLPEGQVTLIWSVVNGTCSDTDEIIIFRNLMIEAQVGSDAQICDATSFALTGNDPTPGVGSWISTSNDVTFDNAANPSVLANNIPLGQTQFVWTVTNGTCISESAPVTISSDNSPVANIGDDITLCEGETHTFATTDGYTSYLWQDGLATDTFFVASTTGTYSVTATNICGETTDEALLTVNPLPEPVIESSVAEVCADEPVSLVATGADSYVWDNDVQQGQGFVPEFTQTYTVTSVTAEGCIAEASVTIEVHNLPEMVDITTTEDGTIALDYFSVDDLTYTMDSTVVQDNGTFSGLTTGTYNFNIQDNNGCKQDVEVYIFVEEPVIIPSLFTPNEDGINDTWEISGAEQYPNGVIYVFDRNGKLMTKYGATEKGWDGYYNGRKVRQDTYWYILELSEEREFKGSITIKY